MKPAVIAKNAIDVAIKMTSLMVHRRWLVVVAPIASEFLWPNQGVDEIDEESEGEQRS
jgi:hypothetical protein